MALNFGPETVLTGEESPSGATPLPVEALAPHFPELEILECLGRGGMGVVYKARQKSLGRLVALKLLAPERERDPQFAQRFTREAQALAVLNHPHIVTVHDFGERDGFFYLLMEYVDGVNLRQLLRARKLSPEEALAIVPPICEALQFAHERGIVHCDIKPENLLLDQTGRVKIADFGIARMIGATAAEEQAAGTPGYMAPEQKATPQRVDSRADIYALGVVFYEMLTGDLPGEKIQMPSRKVHIDVRLDEIVLRALEKSPDLRFQTAADLRTQVEAVVNEPSPEVSVKREATQLGARVGAALAITWAFLALTVVLMLAAVNAPRVSDGGLSGVLIVILVAAVLGAIPLAARLVQRHNQQDSSGPSPLWLNISAGIATVLSFPAIAFALFFAVSLMSESGGWHPGVSEAVVVTATVIGAFLLPIAAWHLWRASLTRGNGDAPNTRGRPWLKFAIALLVVPVIVFLIATVGYLRLAKEDPKSPSSQRAGSAGISAIHAEGHGVYMVQDAERMTYALYHAGRFDHGRSTTSSTTRPDGTWTEEGGLSLQNGTSFGFRRDYEDPEILTINGRKYALKEGRLFVLKSDGSVEQKQAGVGRISLQTLPEVARAAGAPEQDKAEAALDLGIKVAREKLEQARARQAIGVATQIDVAKAEYALTLAEAERSGDRLAGPRARLRLAQQGVELAARQHENGLTSAEDVAEAKLEVARAEAELQRLQSGSN